MSNLDANDKDLIFEYGLGLLEFSQTIQSLIVSDREAARIYGRITKALAPLDSITSKECPDVLVRRTLDRLQAVSKLGVAAEPKLAIVRLGWPGNLSNMAAAVTIAACILIILGAAVPSFSFIRQRYYRQACLNQLEGIYKSIGLYSSDHDGMVPAVARPAGATWADIGWQGPNSYSNARNLFLLAKLDYSKLEDFVCGGSRSGRSASLTPAQLAAYDDFPSRQNVTYSYRLIADPCTRLSDLVSQPLMADMNPHFEVLSKQIDVCPSEEMLCLNSRNHQRKGQNVLWGDGHARFTAKRTVGQRDDDIYTIINTSTYHGLEWPTDSWDTFIAP